MLTILKILGLLLFIGFVLFIGALAMRRNVLANNSPECGLDGEHCGQSECDSDCYHKSGGCCGDEEKIIAKREAYRKKMQESE